MVISENESGDGDAAHHVKENQARDGAIET
jgi:hypothetical protein